MTGGAGRFAPALLAALALAPIASASAAEIADQSGRITLIYDEAMWVARHASDGQPELICAAPDCGGDTAACGASLIDNAATPLSHRTGLEAFRAALDRRTLANARATAGVAANPRIATSAEIVEIGNRTAVTLSLRIDLDHAPMRVDYFWLPASADLVGLSCMVDDGAHERARAAFVKLAEDLRPSP